MLQVGKTYPIILNTLNLVVCVRGIFPLVYLANNLKDMILTQLGTEILAQNGTMSTAFLGLPTSAPLTLPMTLLEDFKALKTALIKAKADGVSTVFIKALQDLKGPHENFSKNMNFIVSELANLAKTMELTIVLGVNVQKLENVPPYALNKKASLWVIEDVEDTLMVHEKTKTAYLVDFDPHSGISFSLNPKEEVVVSKNLVWIETLKEKVKESASSLNEKLSSKVSLEEIMEASKEFTSLCEDLIHKTRQMLSLKDLVDEGILSMDDVFVVAGKGKIKEYKLVESLGEVFLKDKGGDVFKTPSGASSSHLGRTSNGWAEMQVVGKGDLLGLREQVLVNRTQIVFDLRATVSKTKSLSIEDKVLEIFSKEENKGKMFDYQEMYLALNKIYPNFFKGKTPEMTTAALLSRLVKDGKLKVAKPSGTRSKYYL